METTQRLIAALLKSAVTGQAQPLPEGYSLEEAMPLIRKQGLATLAYEGAALCGISRKTPEMQELFKLYYAVLVHSERQMQQVNAIFRSFEEKGIDYLPFKGCVMKTLYPKPELRPMGDADILIRFEQYPVIRKIMEDLGFAMECESDCEQIWKKPELYLELHKCLVQPSHRDYYAYFGDGWGRAVHQAGYRYDFAPEDTYVYLFMHYAKHYRSGGIGCRHVLDIWMYRRANPAMDKDYVNRELDKLHLQEFHANTLALLEHWFGNGEGSDVVDFMTQRIFSGGTFGNSRDYHVFVALSRAKDSDHAKHSRLAYYRRLFFPELKQMRLKYPVLEKHPYLLPLGWVVRGGAVVFGHREKLAHARNVANLVSDEALNAHQDALRFVGLDFHGER